MRSLKRLNQPPLLLLALLILVLGCEDSGVNAPTDGQIIMTADPTTVTINDEDSETDGTSDIMAQVFDASGFALSGISVTFTTSQGTLASKPEDEPAIPVETDANGIARDVLTLTTEGTYSTVDVGARSGTLSGSVQVTRDLTSQNSPPTAVITADPADEQRRGEEVVFDAYRSSDPDSRITCYQWEIYADRDENDDEPSPGYLYWQGPAMDLVRETYYKEQTVGVTLRVSDKSNEDEWCEVCEREIWGVCGAGEANFDHSVATSYKIECDLTDPVANAGGDQSGFVGDVIELDGSGSNDPDPGVTIDSWRWSCGNATEPQYTEVAQCTYNTATTYTATLTVTNSCGLTAEDEIQVTINPAP